MSQQTKESVIKIITEQGILAGEFALLPIQIWFFDQVSRVIYHVINIGIRVF